MIAARSLQAPVERRFSVWVWMPWLGVTLLISVLYGRILAQLCSDWWNEPNLSQGMLLPPLALYFAWLDQRAWRAIPPLPDGRGLFLVAASCMTYLLGIFGAEFFLQRASFVLLIAGLIWIGWGYGRLRRLVFPLLLLLVMIPLPVIFYNAVSAPLQLFASNVSTDIVQTLGTSVYRDGNIIHLANISLGVEEACSGLNSLSALVVAALLLAKFNCRTTPARTLLCLAAVPLAVAVNVVRIAGTALIADRFPGFAMGFYHSFSGWLVFLAGFVLLAGMAKTLAAVLE